MKIIYSAGMRVGSDTQCARIIDKFKDIKVAGHVNYSHSIKHLDWCLDAINNRLIERNHFKLREKFGIRCPRMGHKEIDVLLGEVEAYGPDLIICDFEPIMGVVAKKLGIELWHCSPAHLLDGVEWGYGDHKYLGLLDPYRKQLDRITPGARRLVYSPFGNLGVGLKSGYEWVNPYYIESELGIGKMAVIGDNERLFELGKILNCIKPFDYRIFGHRQYLYSHVKTYNLRDNYYGECLSDSNWIFGIGDTSSLSDGIYGGKWLSIAPRLNDPEALLNATLVGQTEVGIDLGQVELMGRYAVEAIDDSVKVGKRIDNKIKHLDEI